MASVARKSLDAPEQSGQLSCPSRPESLRGTGIASHGPCPRANRHIARPNNFPPLLPSGLKRRVYQAKQSQCNVSRIVELVFAWHLYSLIGIATQREACWLFRFEFSVPASLFPQPTSNLPEPRKPPERFWDQWSLPLRPEFLLKSAKGKSCKHAFLLVVGRSTWKRPCRRHSAWPDQAVSQNFNAARTTKKAA